MIRTALATVLALAALALAPAALAGGTTLKISADTVALKFDEKALTAKAGVVTILMANPSPMPHDVAIKGNGIKPVVGKTVMKGGVSKVTAKLKKGVYRFYCSVPGHEAAGMWGTLTVK